MTAFLYELLKRIDTRRRVPVHVPATGSVAMVPKDQLHKKK